MLDSYISSASVESYLSHPFLDPPWTFLQQTQCLTILMHHLLDHISRSLVQLAIIFEHSKGLYWALWSILPFCSDIFLMSQRHWGHTESILHHIQVEAFTFDSCLLRLCHLGTRRTRQGEWGWSQRAKVLVLYSWGKSSLPCCRKLSFLYLSLVSLGGDHSSLRWVGSEHIDLMDVAHCYCCFALKYLPKIVER